MAAAISTKSTIFISTGEASGDALAAALINEFLKLDPNLSIQGIGGIKMEQAGAELVVRSSDWGAISITESIKKVPAAARGYFRACSWLKKGNPGLFVAVDFGFFNVRLMKRAKQFGWKTLYWMPPGSWRQTDPATLTPDALQKLKQSRMVTNSDCIVTPFPWNRDFLKAGGATVCCFGHPLMQIQAENGWQPTEVRESTVAFLPGSRDHELGVNLPVMAEVAKQLPASILVVAAHLNLQNLEQTWRKLGVVGDGHRVVQKPVLEVLGRVKSAAICSGTATLEAGLAQCPHVIMYKGTKAMEVELKLVGMKIPAMIGMSNIVAGELVFPELLRDRATPPLLLESLTKVESDPELVTNMKRAFDAMRQKLKGETAVTETAQIGLELLRTQNQYVQ